MNLFCGEIYSENFRHVLDLFIVHYWCIYKIIIFYVLCMYARVFLGCGPLKEKLNLTRDHIRNAQKFQVIFIGILCFIINLRKLDKYSNYSQKNLPCKSFNLLYMHLSSFPFFFHRAQKAFSFPFLTLSVFLDMRVYQVVVIYYYLFVGIYHTRTTQEQRSPEKCIAAFNVEPL